MSLPYQPDSPTSGRFRAGPGRNSSKVEKLTSMPSPPTPTKRIVGMSARRLRVRSWCDSAAVFRGWRARAASSVNSTPAARSMLASTDERLCPECRFCRSVSPRALKAIKIAAAPPASAHARATGWCGPERTSTSSAKRVGLMAAPRARGTTMASREPIGASLSAFLPAIPGGLNAEMIGLDVANQGAGLQRHPAEYLVIPQIRRIAHSRTRRCVYGTISLIATHRRVSCRNVCLSPSTSPSFQRHTGAGRQSLLAQADTIQLPERLRVHEGACHPTVRSYFDLKNSLGDL